MPRNGLSRPRNEQHQPDSRQVPSVSLTWHFSPSDPDRQTKKSGDPPTYEAVRTATALYVRNAGGQQEYYDTVNDPYELHNVAANGIPAALPRALHALENCHTGVTCWAAAHLG